MDCGFEGGLQCVTKYMWIKCWPLMHKSLMPAKFKKKCNISMKRLEC